MKDTKQATICKRAVGIDVSKDTLEACYGAKMINERMEFSRSRCFSNTRKGFEELLAWSAKKTDAPEQIWFVMEATGVYYEQLAYFLDARNSHVCVLVATRAKHYAQSLPTKTKTDAVDAQVMARYGLERPLQAWEPASGVLRTIKALLRERAALNNERTRLVNRLHAAQNSWNHPQSSINRLTDHITYIDEQLQGIEDELQTLWTGDQALAEPLERIAEIQGLKELTILTVIAETNGFALRPNRNQLTSYCGLDVVLDESGQRSGPTCISKHGNAHIRRALYMPAVCASQHNPALRAFYNRLMDSRSEEDQKQEAIIAVMRKLLLLIHSLWKSGQRYDPEFHYEQITQAA